MDILIDAYRYPPRVILTSTLYPVEVNDEMDVRGFFVSGWLQDWPLDEMDVRGFFVSGVLTGVLQAYDPNGWQVDDALDVGGFFVSGVLTTFVTLVYNTWLVLPDDAVDVGGFFVSGTLT